MEKITSIGQKLGMSSSDVKYTLNKRRPIMIASVAIIAIAFMGNMLYLGTHYGGISLEDFAIFQKFRFLRYLFGWY